MTSQSVEYALRAMVQLASANQTALSNSQIAEQAGIPAPYLSKLLRKLARVDLIVAKRGIRGGFVLARPPDQISVGDIVRAIDTSRKPERCPLSNPLHTELCPLHRRLFDARAAIEFALSRTSLQEILKERKGCTEVCRECDSH